VTDAEFAARLRGARAYMDLTLEQAGKMLGLSQQSLSRRESGKQPIPESERFYFAAIYLRETDLPPRWFTETDLRRILEPLEDGDDLEPADVVELVERDRDDDGESAGRG
jgi:transcriptional regulator with XRE-family HTH domain